MHKPAPGNPVSSGRGQLALLIAIALALRAASAWTASLHLDDFHSLFHAGAADLGAFFSRLTEDNHPPLSFLVLWAVRSLFGDGELALRLPALVYGMGTVLLVWRLGRYLGDPGARVAAVAFVAVSSLHVALSTDLRMYGLLCLTAAGFLEAAIEELETGRGCLRAGIWAFLGLHTHYHFLYLLFVLGCLAGALVLFAPRYRARRRALATSLGLAALLSLPWFLWGFPRQLAHGLSPGGTDVSITLLGEAMVHLIYLNVSVGGAELRLVFLAGGALVLAASLAGTVVLFRRALLTGVYAPVLLFFGAAFLLPLLTASIASVFERGGFEWRYLAAAIPSFVLVVGAAAGAGELLHARRGALVFAWSGALLLAFLNVFSPGEEDYEGAVARVLERVGPEDAVLAADWQPRIFPHSIAWSYYTRDLAERSTPPVLLEYTDEFTLTSEDELAEFARVLCVLRSIPADVAFLRQLRDEFPSETKESFGTGIFVLTFAR